MSTQGVERLVLKMIENYDNDETQSVPDRMGLFCVDTINSITGEVIKPRKHITLKYIYDGSSYAKGSFRCQFYDHVKRMNITVFSTRLNENYEDDIYDEEDFLSDKYIVVKESSDGKLNYYLCQRYPVDR
jgi:hypothetical protein